MARKPGDPKRNIFACTLPGCDDTFKQNASLVFHMKEKHGVEL